MVYKKRITNPIIAGLLCVIVTISLDAKPTVTLKQLQDSSLSIGLALSGGAAKGLAHIGVIKALEEAGIQIDFIAGTSMGSLVGAFYAAGLPIDTLKKIAIETDWKTAAKLFFPNPIANSGLVDGIKVKELLYTLYGNKNIEDLPIPFSAVATDISTGREYVINKGNLVEAVRTSISIPVVFTPINYNEIYLVDGGLANPIPIDVVREMGADIIIAVHVIHAKLPSMEKEYIEIHNTDDKKSIPETIENISQQIKLYIEKSLDPSVVIKTVPKKEEPKILTISQNSVWIEQDVIANLLIDLYKPEVVIEPDTRDIEIYEFYRGKDAIEIGYNEAKKVLNSLK